MTPYTEKSLGFVELHLARPQHYLRVPYKVQLYEPFPTRDYLSEEWILLPDAQESDYRLSPCGPGFTQKYNVQPRRLIGTVDLASSTVRIALKFPPGETASSKEQHYKFNGEWKLIRPSGPSPISRDQHNCEPSAP